MPNILWVVDEIHMLKGHLLFLEGKGYSFETCNNGNDALAVSYTHLTLPTIYSV